MKVNRRWTFGDTAALAVCLLAVLATALWLAAQTGTNFLTRSPADPYTLQALAWRRGSVSLGQDYPWLELAVYQGDWYVSFGPVPTIPMLLLSLVFGGQTPNALMCLLYFLGGLAAAYGLLLRRLPRAQAAGVTTFAGVGGSLLDVAVSGSGFCGAVWYQAQLLAFALTMLAFLLLDEGTRSRMGWGSGLVCVALAVGCRPLNAVYVPLLLWMLWNRLGRPDWRRAIGAMGLM